MVVLALHLCSVLRIQPQAMKSRTAQVARRSYLIARDLVILHPSDRIKDGTSVITQYASLRPFKRNLVSPISLKRSTPSVQLSTSWPAD